MSDKVFLDTNTLLYSYSTTEKSKCEIVRELISKNNTHISTQVSQELSNVLLTKFSQSPQDIAKTLNECSNNNHLYNNTYSTILLACQLFSKYKYSFYDCLIVAAALEWGCAVLYSEDLQYGHTINKVLKITNPFKT